MSTADQTSQRWSYTDTVLMEQAVDFNETHGSDLRDHVEDRWYFTYAAQSGTGRATRGYLL